MNVQERIAKLEALLARVSTRAGEPRNGHAASPRVDVVVAAAPVAQPVPARIEPPRVTVATPNVAVLPTSLPVVHAAPEEPEEIELAATDLLSSPPPPVAAEAAPAMAEVSAASDEPLESRERLVAAPAVEELTDVQSLPPVAEREEEPPPSDPTVARAPTSMRVSEGPALELAPDDAPEVEVSTSDLDDGGVVDVDMEADEPPASSRRPIALEPPLEELAFGDAAPPPAAHTPPPESGRQVASSAYPEAVQPSEALAESPEAPTAAEVSAASPGLDFDGESTGVRAKADAEAAPAASPTAPPPAFVAEAQVAARTSPPPAPGTVPPPAARTAPPPAPVPVIALAPEVVQPSLDAGASVAAFVGKAPEFQPSSFGDLLDATLAL